MAPGGKKNKKQGSLDAFFGTSAVAKPKIAKQSVLDFAKKRPSPDKEQKEDRKRKKRLIIDDESDDEDVQVKMDVENLEHSSNDNGAAAGTKPKESKPKQTPEKKEAKKPALASRKTADEEEKTSKSKKTVPPTKGTEHKTKAATKRPISEILENSAKDQFKSDDVLEKEITWTTSLPYAVLCEAFGEIEPISGRLAIQVIVTNLFRKVLLQSESDMTIALYLASNSVAAAYECVELGIGDAILIKAIGEATGTSPSLVKQKYEDIGDLGSVAQTCKSKQKTLGGFFTKTAAGLSAGEVLNTFREIAKTKGNQAQKWKVDKIKKLLVRASSPEETKYIIRGLQGKLRIGLAQSTVLISLAHALALTHPKEITASDGSDESAYPDEAKQYIDGSVAIEKRLEAAVAIVKKAYSEVPSYDAIVEAAMKVPLQEMHGKCTLKPGIPIEPMLAKPTKSIQEVLKRLNGVRFTCEYKYDGERAQVHLLPGGDTRVFSRNLLDTSEKYPEVPSFVKESCKDVDSFVLDAEVVAFNRETGQLVPFQVLSTRKKTEESAETAKVQVIVQAFDLMYLNGKSLLNLSLAERRDLMFKHFEPVDGKFQFAKSIDHEENGETTVLEEFLESAVKGQCEGLMVKTLDDNAIYEPSRRSLNWLKLKKDYLEGLGDSFDLVPLGAYHGKGKRTGFYGAYLLACYDPDTEEFQSVCKIGTGFSDEDLKELADNLNKHKIGSKSSQYAVSSSLECDVWFDTVEVWEVKAADLSKSSAHRGAQGKTGEEGRGVGLRFPRFERVRDDKKPEDATTSDQILEMYYAQDTVVGDNGGDDE